MTSINQEASASSLANNNDLSNEKDSPKIALKPVESDEIEENAQKRASPSSPSDADDCGGKQNDGNVTSKEDHDTKPPAAKKRRVGEELASCPLLECSSEIMRNVYSFLLFKDALEVRRTCHALYDGNMDVFQYSNLDRLKNVSGERMWKYNRKRLFVLCNLGSADKLRAILRNETMPMDFLHYYLCFLVEKSKTDDAEAVSILIEHKVHVKVDVEMLETALKRNFTQMAEILKGVESIKNDIQMCATCSVSIGCYFCHRGAECTNSNNSSSKFCRSCMLAVNKICAICNEYICPSCLASGIYHACEKCNGVNCYNDAFNDCDGVFYVCQGLEGRSCDRKKCMTCIRVDREEWFCMNGIDLCPDCAYAMEHNTDNNHDDDQSSIMYLSMISSHY